MEDREQYRLLGGVSMLVRKMRRMLEHRQAELGLTGVQGQVLAFIMVAPRDLFQKDIEEEFDLRGASATGLLKQLGKNGFITRVAVPEDARLKKIVLLPKAKRIQQRVLKQGEAMEKALRKGLTRKEIDLFMSLAGRLGANIESIPGR